MKTFFKYLKPTIIPLLLAAILGLLLWQQNMTRLNSRSLPTQARANFL